MSATKCNGCGSTDIETDPARGDSVCTQCGMVLDDQIIVNDNEFLEGPQGNIRVQQFVSISSSGGASRRVGNGFISDKESREITLKNARKGITHLGEQLGLKQANIDHAVGLYKLALMKNLTRGRKQTHNHAACVYMACRLGKTDHLLIDISDVLQICVQELGRTYLKFAYELRLNIPCIDPCLYLLRFANKLQFGNKTQAVFTTATRVVQRMKRDSIDTGRRPSGLCGAALLIAARLHEFNRSPADIIKVVKVHESTLRKRLIEFGETPSSALTLEEFMTVDLEEEQDPPAFKAAKKKDRERLSKIQNMDQELNDLQLEIEKLLDFPKLTKNKKKEDPTEFIRESNFTALQSCVADSVDPPSLSTSVIDDSAIGLGPNLSTMGLDNPVKIVRDKPIQDFEDESGEINLSDIDDDELNAYIMTEKEAEDKRSLWYKLNEKYLEEQKVKEEKRLKDKEEGKPEKKRKKVKKTKNQTPANSAGEAIEKMLQEKKISSKINYEVLKSLNIGTNSSSQKNMDVPSLLPNNDDNDNFVSPADKVLEDSKSPSTSLIAGKSTNLGTKRKLDEDYSNASSSKKSLNDSKSDSAPIVDMDASEDFADEEEDDYIEDDGEAEELSVRDMLKRRNGDDDDPYSYDYDDYEEY